MHVVTRRQSGVAMLLALLTMVVVAGIGTLLFARTINEMKHSKDDAAIVQTLLLARGGANLGGSLLTGSIRDALDAIVNVRSSTTSCWSFGDGACGNPAPTPNSVLTKLTGANSVATELQVDIDALLCDDTLDEMQPNATVSVRVYVTSTACGQPLPSTLAQRCALMSPTQPQILTQCMLVLRIGSECATGSVEEDPGFIERRQFCWR